MKWGKCKNIFLDFYDVDENRSAVGLCNILQGVKK